MFFISILFTCVSSPFLVFLYYSPHLLRLLCPLRRILFRRTVRGFQEYEAVFPRFIAALTAFFHGSKSFDQTDDTKHERRDFSNLLQHKNVNKKIRCKLEKW